MTPPSDYPTPIGALSASRMYQDYARAFTRGTGLPLDIHAPELMRIVDFDRKRANPFCALMAKTRQSCAACYGLQQRLEAGAQLESKTLTCFAGLCETAVPVRVGGKLIAFLQTGHVLLHRPNRTEFSKVVRTLLSFGEEVDLKRLEEAYFNTRVLSKQQYEGLIRLLTIFAEHLAQCGEALLLQGQPEEPAQVAHARRIIADHAQDDLSLAWVAHAVNMSANYFSEKFKEITGINFVTYVARTRIEKARNLLSNPKLRVSEIAFEVGFQSLSQFNRDFKRVTGQAPSAYRRSHAG
ncbi:MAG TPA: helix-turn-helix domain-containing protein [Chthoniobacteraceae bacterium]|nr:helix-turn-helix domain-containing protein [Chthoniobacteraceae bacterium]